MMTAPLCLTCARLWDKEPGIACEAFPEGIPDGILDNRVAHTSPYPGDNGLTYQERTP